jgi:hypothetical protein
LVLAVDRTFEPDGVRVQSAGARDPGALRDRYRAILAAFSAFASGEPEIRSARSIDSPPPLTLVVVPQSVLDDPKLWPGYPFKPDASYPSRYVETRRTLFVADTPGFEVRELPYGVALHALAPVRSLSTERLLSLAEKFEADYSARSGK